MDIKLHNITIDQQALTPTLIIELLLEFPNKIEAPISISGRLLSSHNKVLSLLDEYQLKANSNNFGLGILSKIERGNIVTMKYKNSYHAQLTATLAPKAIEHIEIVREKDPEKSVRLIIDIVIKFLDMPATSLQAGYDFLNVNINRGNINAIIKQSDWVNNYSPHLGIGNFLLLELAIPDNHK